MAPQLTVTADRALTQLLAYIFISFMLLKNSRTELHLPLPLPPLPPLSLPFVLGLSPPILSPLQLALLSPLQASAQKGHPLWGHHKLAKIALHQLPVHITTTGARWHRRRAPSRRGALPQTQTAAVAEQEMMGVLLRQHTAVSVHPLLGVMSKTHFSGFTRSLWLCSFTTRRDVGPSGS